jgi:signal transduction histidine kinase
VVGYSDALGRALSFCANLGTCSLEAFLRRAAWELYHLVSSDVASVAFVLARTEGGRVVCKPDQVATLPIEILSGLSIDAEKEADFCRVRDHALDSVRFLDARFRTSIIGAVRLPECLRSEATSLVLWAGLCAGASSKRIEMMSSMRDEVSAWFAVYGQSLRAIQGLRENVDRRGALIRDMRAVAHDARAPLASLQYLLGDIASVSAENRDEFDRIRVEVEYVTRLLEQLSPYAEQAPRFDTRVGSVDLLGVLRRVVSRYLPEIKAKGGAVQWSVPYAETLVVMSELECERIFSNIIGNAARHSDTAMVRVEVEPQADGKVVTRVRDSGPGFPRSIIERLKAPIGESASLKEAQGWGVGLLSCKLKVEAHGGAFSIDSEIGGSRVEIALPGARRPKSSPVLQVAEPEFSGNTTPHSARTPYVDVIVVDDDGEHLRSLERLLNKSGIRASSCNCVDDALEQIKNICAAKVLCDAKMPDGGAERLLASLGGVAQGMQIGVMSAESNEQALYRYAALGAQEYFLKPVDLALLLEWIKAPIRQLKQVS